MASILNTLGQIIGKMIKWIALAICGLVVIVTITPLAMRMIGYRVNANSSEVAALAVQKKDVSLCKSIISIGLFYPQSGELRSHCVFTYAKLAEDPTVCELLMPSNYGWSCLSVARETGDACDINYNRDVTWTLNSVYDTPQRATIEECRNGTEKSKKGKDCCYILRLTSEPDINDCSPFQGNTPFMNLCLAQLAVKQKNPNICANINDENKRIICELQAKWYGKK